MDFLPQMKNIWAVREYVDISYKVQVGISDIYSMKTIGISYKLQIYSNKYDMFYGNKIIIKESKK